MNYVHFPKKNHGVLITCEESIKLYIKSREKGDKKFIMCDLDPTHLLIREGGKLLEVQEEVFKMQDNTMKDRGGDKKKEDKDK